MLQKTKLYVDLNYKWLLTSVLATFKKKLWLVLCSLNLESTGHLLCVPHSKPIIFISILIINC
jgi:hypothetical protein